MKTGQNNTGLAVLAHALRAAASNKRSSAEYSAPVAAAQEPPQAGSGLKWVFITTHENNDPGNNGNSCQKATDS
jgi:hypothetical protein